MKTKQLLFPILFFFVFTKINAQNYHVLLDGNVSSISSSESLTSLYHSIYSLEDKLLPKTFGKKIKPKWLRYTTGCFVRLGKGIFWDFPVASLFTVTQHEIFGHGYQYRQMGYLKNSYYINTPPPYGRGGGFARWGTFENSRIIGKHESIAIYYSGAEAVRIFSNTITKKWIFADSIHYKEAILAGRTFRSSHNAMLYLKETTLQNVDDFSRYLVRVNSYYGFNNIDDYQLTYKHLRKKALINFLNPFNGFGLFSGFINYGFQGKKYGKLYWLKLGKIKYLPSFRVGLTPFGDEVFFESFIKPTQILDGKSPRAARIYYRHGNPVFEKFNGFGIETFHWFNFSEKIILDFNLDGWIQPELKLGGEEIRLTKKGLGGLVKINFQIRMWEDPKPVYLSGQIGYKTDGYIEGEPLASGLILRYGFAYGF